MVHGLPSAFLLHDRRGGVSGLPSATAFAATHSFRMHLSSGLAGHSSLAFRWARGRALYHEGAIRSPCAGGSLDL